MALSYGFCLGLEDAQYDSAQFSQAFHALSGDGLASYGDRFSLTLDGFTVTLAPGYARAAGRWLKSDAPVSLTLRPSGNYEDRTDAIAVQVDFQTRAAALAVLEDVDPGALRQEPEHFRNRQEYSLILYFVRVKRGATVLYAEDVTDCRGDGALCGMMARMDEVSADILYVHQFLTSGIDREVARLTGLSGQAVKRADNAMADIDAAIQTKGTTGTGEIAVSKVRPTPAAAWLPCDGSSIPPGYPALDALLGGTLPKITPADRRFQAYIYGGAE